MNTAQIWKNGELAKQIAQDLARQNRGLKVKGAEAKARARARDPMNRGLQPMQSGKPEPIANGTRKGRDHPVNRAGWYPSEDKAD